jgi:hypothetical protein
MSRTYTIFACSYIVTGNLLNLELRFPEKPLLSEIRARIVNAFRTEEAAIIDRSQSIGFDVALLFTFDGAIQRWRVVETGDVVDGLQVYAQPRLSNSAIRAICDNADAIEMQKIPAPVHKQMHQPPSLKQASSRNYSNYHEEEVLVLSSDDDDDDNNNNNSPVKRAFHEHQNTNNNNGTDLALAETWDQACRTLFSYLDDDHDGLVSISDIPFTLERIATRAEERGTVPIGHDSDPFYLRPPSFNSSNNDNESHTASLVDETSFVAFCCRPENAGIVSGLLAFIHNCNRSIIEAEHHQKILDRIQRGMNPQYSYSSPLNNNHYNNNSPPRFNNNPNDLVGASSSSPMSAQHYHMMMTMKNQFQPQQRYF